jgi:putative FmdB family regulatory protein
VPTYDYHCDQCGADFELRLRFSDLVEQDCVNEECSAIARRLFSVVPVVFKGSGWYVNDYGNKTSASAKTAETSSSDQSNTDNKSSKSDNKSSKSDNKSNTTSSDANSSTSSVSANSSDKKNK